MVTHLEYEPELNNEVIAGIRTHWDGLFILGAPDVRVVNVTKDAIYARDAVLPELGAVPRPSPQVMLKAYELDELPEVIEMPPAKLPREEQQIPYLREIEIDPHKYTPKDVDRDLILESPPMKFNLKEMMAAQQKAQEEE
jgi:hypothetical protein